MRSSSAANRSISRFRVWMNEGLMVAKMGKTRLRTLFRLYPFRALVLSSRQDRLCSRAKASISSRVMERSGLRRGMSPKSGSGRKPSAFMPVMPRSPVPRNKFRISVSALSLALCATATASYPCPRQSCPNQWYRSLLAAISMEIPSADANASVSKRFTWQGMP